MTTDSQRAMASGRIAALNARALELLDALKAEGAAYDEELDAIAACEQAAGEAGLIVAVRVNDCTMYRDTDGSLVNLWRQGRVHASLGAGGIGFDNCVEWYYEEFYS